MVAWVADSPLEGSSPLTRGAPLLFVHAVDALGLIPAYAGSTFVVFGGVGADQAHPRLRGEHLVLNAVQPGHMGSSPLTRGALDVQAELGTRAGLIPAYAGSTDVFAGLVPG